MESNINWNLRPEPQPEPEKHRGERLLSPEELARILLRPGSTPWIIGGTPRVEPYAENKPEPQTEQTQETSTPSPRRVWDPIMGERKLLQKPIWEILRQAGTIRTAIADTPVTELKPESEKGQEQSMVDAIAGQSNDVNRETEYKQEKAVLEERLNALVAAEAQFRLEQERTKGQLANLQSALVDAQTQVAMMRRRLQEEACFEFKPPPRVLTRYVQPTNQIYELLGTKQGKSTPKPTALLQAANIARDTISFFVTKGDLKRFTRRLQTEQTRAYYNAIRGNLAEFGAFVLNEYEILLICGLRRPAAYEIVFSGLEALISFPTNELTSTALEAAIDKMRTRLDELITTLRETTEVSPETKQTLRKAAMLVGALTLGMTNAYASGVAVFGPGMAGISVVVASYLVNLATT